MTNSSPQKLVYLDMKILILPLLIILISCSSQQRTASGHNTDRAENGSAITPTNASITLAEYLKRIPGVQVSKIGQNYQVLVRGNSSMGEQREPLFIINGMNAGFGYERAAPLVDVNDIEYVQVLKSGSETARYGMQGSNGVIVITTKR